MFLFATLAFSGTGLRIWMVIAVTVLGIAQVGNIKIGPKQIGALYDCTSIQQSKMFKVNKVDGCGKQIMNKLENRTQKYFQVKKYFINKTPFRVIYCEHNRVTLRCKKEFFGSNSKGHSTTAVMVKPNECWRAYEQKIAPGGHLFKITPSLYTTHSADSYSCSWMKTKYSSFDHFTLRVGEAYLEGEQDNIHQPLVSF